MSKDVNYYIDGTITEGMFLSKVRHRVGGPATIVYYEDSDQISYESWIQNNQYHREDGPAYIEYHMNGKPARIDYYINDYFCRLDGPAHTIYDEIGNICKELYATGHPHFYTKEDWEQLPEVQEYRLNQLINKELAC
jgi:hypothetical protein